MKRRPARDPEARTRCWSALALLYGVLGPALPAAAAPAAPIPDAASAAPCDIAPANTQGRRGEAVKDRATHDEASAGLR